MSILEIEGLSFGFTSDRMIIEDISYRLDEPKFVCIVGPNGVGKSTLIKCINGFYKPNEGTISISDRFVEEYSLKELAQKIGYVPVSAGDVAYMTVLDTVMVGRYAKQSWKTKSEDIILSHKALESMEVDHLAMSFFNELSAGQHQKVAISRGLVQESEILILDEPTSNLDVRHQVYVMAFLKRLCEVAKITVIMVSHDLNLSSKYADELIVMEPPGRIYTVGTPAEVITEEMVRRIYGVNCRIVEDEGHPCVILHDVIFG